MRESARECQYTLHESDRYKSVYSACRGENTVCTLIAYRAAEFGDLSAPRAENGKYEERQTISPAPVLGGRTPPSLEAESILSSILQRRTIDARQCRSDKRVQSPLTILCSDITLRIIHPAGIHRHFIHRAQQQRPRSLMIKIPETVIFRSNIRNMIA